MSKPEDEQDEVDSAAAAWVARLGGGPLSPPERHDLDMWLGQSRRHANAFREAQAAWKKMGQIRFAPDGPARQIGQRQKTGAAAGFDGNQSHGKTRSWFRNAALAACLAVLIGGAVLWFGDPTVVLRADYSTAPGVRESITLADGSSINLGPASAIAVHYTERERRIELLRGLAYFAAEPLGDSERRPFIVAAADGTARALGTRFMLQRIAETVEVTVIEHAVEVALSRDDRERSAVVVSPGQAVRYTNAALGEVQSINPDHALAWQRGRLIVDHRPLGDVVAELNRYRRGLVVIADPALASRRVSGVFDTSDPDAALATIVRDLRIDSTYVPPLMTVLY